MPLFAARLIKNHSFLSCNLSSTSTLDRGKKADPSKLKALSSVCHDSTKVGRIKKKKFRNRNAFHVRQTGKPVSERRGRKVKGPGLSAFSSFIADSCS